LREPPHPRGEDLARDGQVDVATVALGPAQSSLAWVAALITPVALLGLLLLMQLLEDRWAQRALGDQIVAALATTASPEDIERLVADATAHLLRPRPQ